MGKKFLLILVASLFAACLTLTLTLFLVQPASAGFRLATVATLVALLPLVLDALRSQRAFRRERRIASARLINEVRLHRAETKLLHADMEDLARSLGAEGNNATRNHEEIKREMQKVTAQLANHSATRAKQLVAILEVQRIELARLSMEVLKQVD